MFYHQHPLNGLNNLITGSSLQSKFEAKIPFNSQDLGFILSPILNSSGRISHARLSIKVLLEDNKDATSLLVQTNQNRKQIVKDYISEINSEVDEQIALNSDIIWLVGSWNKGVIGLIASRLVNKHNLPVVVISQSKQTFNEDEINQIDNAIEIMIDKITNLNL